jgi:hypothetical protein
MKQRRKGEAAGSAEGAGESAEGGRRSEEGGGPAIHRLGEGRRIPSSAKAADDRAVLGMIQAELAWRHCAARTHTVTVELAAPCGRKIKICDYAGRLFRLFHSFISEQPVEY